MSDIETLHAFFDSTNDRVILEQEALAALERVEFDFKAMANEIGIADETIERLKAERDALRAKLEKAIEALKPFAREADRQDTFRSDDTFGTMMSVGSLRRACAAFAELSADDAPVQTPKKFPLGSRIEKIKGSSWRGHVVGFYSTELTPNGYCVESERERGSVQIYPESALRAVDAALEVMGAKTGKEVGR